MNNTVDHYYQKKIQLKSITLLILSHVEMMNACNNVHLIYHHFIKGDQKACICYSSLQKCFLSFGTTLASEELGLIYNPRQGTPKGGSSDV